MVGCFACTPRRGLAVPSSTSLGLRVYRLGIHSNRLEYPFLSSRPIARSRDQQRKSSEETELDCLCYDAGHTCSTSVCFPRGYAQLDLDSWKGPLLKGIWVQFSARR